MAVLKLTDNLSSRNLWLPIFFLSMIHINAKANDRFFDRVESAIFQKENNRGQFLQHKLKPFE